MSLRHLLCGVGRKRSEGEHENDDGRADNGTKNKSKQKLKPKSSNKRHDIKSHHIPLSPGPSSTAIKSNEVIRKSRADFRGKQSDEKDSDRNDEANYYNNAASNKAGTVNGITTTDSDKSNHRKKSFHERLFGSRKKKSSNRKEKEACKSCHDIGGIEIKSTGPTSKNSVIRVEKSHEQHDALESLENEVKKLKKQLQASHEMHEREKSYLTGCVDLRQKEIGYLQQQIEQSDAALECNKQDLLLAQDKIATLESVLHDDDNIQKCQIIDVERLGLVQAFDKIVVALPRDKERKVDNVSSEVKEAMRLLEKFIGPRWKEMAREMNLSLEVMEQIQESADQRPTEIFWNLMSQWQQQEDVTLMKILTVCERLGIDIHTDKPMPKKHRCILDKNREQLVHDIIHPKHVLHRMMKYLNVPEGLRDHVLADTKLPRPEGVAKLLDILPALGSPALPVFILALDKTGYHEVAEILAENPMPNEHRNILEKFRLTIINYCDVIKILPSMAKYTIVPGWMYGYINGGKTKEDKMERLLEVLPCLGQQAMNVLINTLDDTRCLQVSCILKDKAAILQGMKRRYKDVSTQIEPEEVVKFDQAPLTGHRKNAKPKEQSVSEVNYSSNRNEYLLMQDNYYASEMATKEREASIAMDTTSIETEVNRGFECLKSVEILRGTEVVRYSHFRQCLD